MAKILFLAHRAPFPPDKGDKIRAHRFLAHLAGRHEVWLGAGAEESADAAHALALQAGCRQACVPPLGRLRRGLNMVAALPRGAPISVARFRHPRLARWIDRTLREVRPDLVFVYSSALAQYVMGRLPPGASLLVDFVDADAQKWRAYAAKVAPPGRWLYAAEARRLAAFERRVLDASSAAIVITETERRLQAQLLGVDPSRLRVVPNGVDADYFNLRPAASTRPDIVFCGRMDYAPNVDGAAWFAHEILPKVRERVPAAAFRVVGAAPVARVRALAALPGVEVTGPVPDVRPYLAEAAVVVAPLRIARGIQNKVLEALAAGRPVVATPDALDGVSAVAGRDVLVGAEAEGFAAAVADVLTGRAPPDLGARGREAVLRAHRWAAQESAIDYIVDGALGGASGEAAA